MMTRFHSEKRIKCRRAYCRKITIKSNQNATKCKLNWAYLSLSFSLSLQPSIRHIFPFVLSWHGSCVLHSVRLFQWFIHHEFCVCDFTFIGRFLDSEKHYRTFAGGAKMVELHRWRWQIALGVWTKKGTIEHTYSVKLVDTLLIIAFLSLLSTHHYCMPIIWNIYFDLIFSSSSSQQQQKKNCLHVNILCLCSIWNSAGPS